MTTDKGRAWITVVVAGCLVFAAYAGSFLYFFVDDEAIPLVYARNLLRGRGLVYTALEGRGEGYSDFLHVLWNTAVLYVTTGLNLSRLAPLLVGKAVSFVAGAGILVVVGRRRRDVWNVAWPVCLAAVAFHAWRWSFFGSFLSEPLAAKVLYRLSGSSQIVVKSAGEPYLRGFLRLYGVAAAPAFVVTVVLAW